MKDKRREAFLVRAFYLCAIVSVFLVCVYNVGLQQRIRVVDDEFAYWGIAAHLAGFDWSGALSKTEYYNYGYSLILVPLYWLIRAGVSVTLVYRIAICMNAVFLCASFCIAVAVGKRIFSESNPLLIQAAALLSVLFVSNVIHSGCAWTEVYLVFMFWCCLYCVVRVAEKPSGKWIFLALLSAAYLFAIHMRTIGVVLVVMGIVLLRILMTGEKLDKKKLFLTVGWLVILMVVLMGMRSYVKNNIYLADSGNVYRNDFAGQMEEVKMLFSFSGLVDILLSICGKIFYIGVASYCLGIFTVFVALRKCFGECFRCLKLKCVPRKAFYVYLFLAATAAGAVCVDALFKVYPYYYSGLTYKLPDAIIYGRYVEFIIGPLLFFGILLLQRHLKFCVELLLSIPALIGCGLAAQKMWDILLFYNGTDLGLRENAVQGIIYMLSGNVERLAYVLTVWALGGFAVLLLIFAIDQRLRCKTRLLVSFCCGIAVIFAVVGNVQIEKGIEAKANKWKDVDSVAELLATVGEQNIYYVTRSGSVVGDMKILQWEMPDRTIRLLENESEGGYMLEEEAVYLADSSDDRLNALLSEEGIYLYDSGTIAVYVKRGSRIAEEFSEVVHFAYACADPKTVNVKLTDVVAEYAYQKANGSIYLSNQRTEEYLTWGTGLTLEDGVYQFEVNMELSYYEGGEIGYITVTNDQGTYLATRVLEINDFDKRGKASISVELPVRDYEEPVIGVYVYGNGAMKITGITYTQIVGNIAVQQGQEEEWKQIVEVLNGLCQSQKLPVWYVDTDGSAQSGFPDFEWAESLLSTEISVYHTGRQIENMDGLSGCYLIMEKTGEETEVPETMTIVSESENYFILIPKK